MCNIKKCPFLTASFKEAIEQITKWQTLKFQLAKELSLLKSLKPSPVENIHFTDGQIFATESIIHEMEEMEKKLK